MFAVDALFMTLPMWTLSEFDSFNLYSSQYLKTPRMSYCTLNLRYKSKSYQDVSSFTVISIISSLLLFEIYSMQLQYMFCIKNVHKLLNKLMILQKNWSFEMQIQTVILIIFVSRYKKIAYNLPQFDFNFPNTKLHLLSFIQ